MGTAPPSNEMRIKALETTVRDLTRNNTSLKKEVTTNKQLATSATRELGRLKIELQRLITRMNQNEADVRHLNSKR
jgi:phage host-nuclease inhibitor protein Gam